MPTVQEWGRKESIIWPPRGFYFTYGAIFLAIVVTGFLMYVHFHFSLSPLEEYYLPYYIRTETAGVFRPTGMYQLVYITDWKSQSRIAMDADVAPGQTRQFSGKSLPLVLSDHALQQGFRSIFREVQHPYQNNGLHMWLGHWIYAETSLLGLFATPFYCGLLALGLQLPFSIRKDIKRRKELRYGRRLKGPILVTARQFTKAVAGDGIGITTNDGKRPLRIPRNAENKHFLLVGDTGSGKSSIIRQMLYQVAARGESAIVYDPACEFVKQFYSDRRGDIVLNPLDARMPYWNPSEELRRKAEAKALAVSLYQPEGVTNKFFVEAPQKIFAHLMTFLPTPAELVAWMSNPAEIDRRVKGTEACFVRCRSSEEQNKPETARKGTNMKLEDIKNKTKDAVDYLVHSLESGHSEVLTHYLGAMARFHTYSFGNVMLIARQKPDATNVAGIRAWNSLGRFVKRGEKGILILAPMVGNRRSRQNQIATDIDTDNAADERKPEHGLIGFRAVYVFDISQTEGKELPTLTEVQGDVGGYRERLFEFLQSQGVELSYSERIAPAKGLSHGGKITLLSGMQPAEEFSTLVHEIAHEMLHRGDRRTLTTKKVRETEAEAVAFVVGKAIGLETGTASADYIQLWHGDANLLRESLEAVQQTAAVIVGAVAPKPEQTLESGSGNSLSDSVPYSPPPSVESAAESVPF